MSSQLGWLDSYWGIMFPGMMTAFGTFLMKQFFETIASRARHIYKIANRDVVAAANRLATGGVVPDAVIVLDIERTVGVARQAAQGKGLDRLEREAESFHDRVHAEYRAYRGPGIVHLDASAAPDVYERSGVGTSTVAPSPPSVLISSPSHLRHTYASTLVIAPWRRPPLLLPGWLAARSRGRESVAAWRPSVR